MQEESWTTEGYFLHVLGAAACWAQWLAGANHPLTLGQAASIEASIEQCKKFLRDTHGFQMPEGDKDLGLLSEKPADPVE